MVSFAAFLTLVRRVEFVHVPFAWSAGSWFPFRTILFFGILSFLLVKFRNLPVGDRPLSAREAGGLNWTYGFLFWTLFFVAFSDFSPMAGLTGGFRRAVFWILQASVLLVFLPPVLKSRQLLALTGYAVLSIWAFSHGKPVLLLLFWPAAIWLFFENMKHCLAELGFYRTGFVQLTAIGAGMMFARFFGSSTEGLHFLFFLLPLLFFALQFSLFPRFPRPAAEASWSFPWSSAGLVAAIILTGAVLLFPSVHAVRPGDSPPEEPEEMTLQEKPFLHIRNYKEGRLQIVADSAEIPETAGIRGYAGPVAVLIVFDEKCVIESVQLGRHRETPSYVEMFLPWMKKFSGMGPQQSILEEVDTVSGATLSTRAVRQIVHQVRARVCTEILQVETDTREVAGPRNSPVELALPVILLLAGLFFWFRYLPWGRLILLMVSLVTLGFVTNLQLSLVDLGLFAHGTVPAAWPKALLLVAALAGALVLGPLWCGFLCPAGAFQEILFVLVRMVRSGVRGWKTVTGCVPSLIPDRKLPVMMFRFLKYVLLAVSLAGFMLTLNQRFLSWDPLSFLFAFPPVTWAFYPVVITMAAGSALVFRPFCRFFCPLGAGILILGRVAPLRRFFPVRILKSCDYGVHSAGDISCIRCQRCCTNVKGKSASLSPNE